MAHETAEARREVARLRKENARLVERVRELSQPAAARRIEAGSSADG
jgi:hypothetical protein